MKPINTFRGSLAALPMENIDTDQIIPARFLKVTDKAGLGEALFADWRYDAEGRPKPDFPLNLRGSPTVLVAGHNFGCGSSREHAPWALLGYGFRAVVSTYFADIFRSNALKNGLLPIVVDAEAYGRLLALAETPAEVEIDLAAQTLTLPDGSSVEFPVEPFAKQCLLHGVDQLGFLMEAEDAIAAYEATHPAMVCTTAGWS
jgi:3-isopropylmalate/(R)-2-methylmalate dehydratase small subunit